MKKRFLISAGAIAFLLGSLTQLPARMLLPALPANIPLAPETVTGTVWRGGIRTLNWQNLRFTNLQWDLRPAALLSGKLSADIRGNLLPAGQFDGQCSISPSGNLSCTNLTVSDLPATTINPYLRAFRTPPLTGTFQLDLAQLEWDQQTLPAGSGRVEWQAAGIQLAPQRYGDYRATLTTEGSTRQINLASAADAAFELSGNVAVQETGEYRSNLNLKPRASVNDATQRFLQTMLGRPQPDGSFRIRDQGQIPLPATNANRRPAAP